MNEEWRPVLGYEGIYEVSSHGRVKRIAPHATRGTIKGLVEPKRDRYFRVTLFRDGKKRLHGVHVLVAEAFIGPRPVGMVVDHISGNTYENYVWNLQYLTPKENTRKGIAFDLRDTGVRDNRGKLTIADVAEIRRLSSEGVSRAELGRRYGVSAPHITQIVLGIKWKESYAANTVAVSV